MKKLLFVALALACFAGVANAQNTRWAQPVWERGTVLNFRTLGSGSNADTAWATGAAARSDTTIAFNLGNVYFPSLVPLASDSVVAMVVRVTPITTSGITIQGDSAVFILPQVSMDGTTWTSMTAPGISEGSTYHITGANKLGFNSGVPGTAGTNGFFFPLWQNYLASGFISYATTFATAPRANQWFGWNYVRFIMGTANTWKAQLSVDYLTVQ